MGSLLKDLGEDCVKYAVQLAPRDTGLLIGAIKYSPFGSKTVLISVESKDYPDRTSERTTLDVAKLLEEEGGAIPASAYSKFDAKGHHFMRKTKKYAERELGKRIRLHLGKFIK